MNPNANDATANRPAPPAKRPPSTLRVVVPLVALVGVVFGITLFSMYTPKQEDETKAGPGSEPPLRFFSSTREWIPTGRDLQNRIFPGFYEAGGPDNLHPAAFWFENRNPKSVTMQLKGVTCLACSGGRLAAIPPPVSRDILQMTAVSLLPQGLFSGLPTGMVGPAANLGATLAPGGVWQKARFRDDPDATYKIPAADNADGWSPQWGILELLFAPKIGAVASDPLGAQFATQIDGTTEAGTAKFTIAYESVGPFDVVPGKIDVERIDLGLVRDQTQPRKYELTVFSRTRGPGRDGPNDHGDLAPPKAVVEMPPGTAGEPGPFVTVGEPVRVPEAELFALSMGLSERLNRSVGVTAAYRVPVTVAPKAGDATVDVGPLERDVWLSVPGADARQSVRVSGMVRGKVALDNDRTDIVLGAYSSATGLGLDFRLITDDKDAVVAVVKDQCRPDFLDVKVTKEPPASDRGYHKLQVSVPPKARRGPWNGVIVLEVKGPTPQRIRIPVRGQGS